MWGLLNTRESVGYPVHLVEERGGDGVVTRSFGSENPAFRADAPALTVRRVAPASGDRLWLAHPRNYVIEQWTAEGEKLLEIRREADWFPPWDGSPPGDFEESPPGIPAIHSVWEDSEGFVWVRVRVPDPNYRENYALLQPSGTGMGRIIVPSARHGLHDTIIEVIDPATGRLVASRRIDEAVRVSADGRLLLVYEEGPSGEARYDLFVAELVRPSIR